MNEKARQFLKNIAYALFSNGISFILSALLILILPKFMGVNDYGYWQLYLFYIGYVGFLHFGWIDGIYLRYGGMEYKHLNKNLFFSQFYMFLFFQIIISVCILVFTLFISFDFNHVFVLRMVSLALIMVNTRFMFLYLLQSTNRIKEYAISTILDRLCLMILLIIILTIGIKDFKIIVFIDMASKLVSLLYVLYCCRDIALRRISEFYFSFKETVANVRTGIKMMLANLANLLIIGNVRFGIERGWDISTFGRVSLMLSISGFMMLFINAVGVAIFPLLRRTETSSLPRIYISINHCLFIILAGILLLYYPIHYYFSIWLTEYREYFNYLYVLFPLFIFEGKISLLLNPYLKSMRKENMILKINIVVFIISFMSTFFTVVILKNLSATVISILILIIVKTIALEVYLAKELEIKKIKDMMHEIILTLIFIISVQYLTFWHSLLFYFASYIIFIVINRKEMIKAAETLWKLAKIK
jgi:O-antigen/teichoic acid export membrane protein